MSAAPMSFWLPWAVHLSDGVLQGPWLAAGFVLIGLLLVLAAYRVQDDEIPRIALLSAAFFVATLMHLPLGPTRVHLLLNGLVGVVLGRRAPLAIVMGLTLQAVLLGHGGFTTIGVNACVMTLPALLVAALFVGLRRLPWFGRGGNTLTWLCGFLLGAVSVLATLVLQAAVLLWGGAEDWHQIVWLVFYAHLPLVALEGVVLGFTVNFLARVKPEMLGLSPDALRRWHDSSDPASAAQDITPAASQTAAPPQRKGEAIRSASSSPPVALMLAVLALLLAARPTQAHKACAAYYIRSDRQVQIDGWYDPGDLRMKGAKVQVFRPGQRLLAEGVLDDNGSFVFRYTEVEPLEVIVNGGVGHRKAFIIPPEKLQANTAETPSARDSVPKDSSPTVAPVRREHPDSWREQLKDALLGISFLLSLGAFLLSWRTSRRLHQSERKS